MQRTMSPQLAIAASASVLAMAAFALLGPARPTESTDGADLGLAPMVQAAELPVAGRFLPLSN